MTLWGCGSPAPRKYQEIPVLIFWRPIRIHWLWQVEGSHIQEFFTVFGSEQL